MVPHCPGYCQCPYRHHLHHHPQHWNCCRRKHLGTNEPAGLHHGMQGCPYPHQDVVADWQPPVLPAHRHFQLEGVLQAKDWLVHWRRMGIFNVSVKNGNNGNTLTHLGDTDGASRAIRSAFLPRMFKPRSRHSACSCFTVRFFLREHQLEMESTKQNLLTWCYLPHVW